MMNNFISPCTEEEIKKEKMKARDLRKTQWWKQKCSRGICHYCRQTVSPEELTMDHIVPIVRGGRSTKNNLVPACKTCNNKKKHSLPMEWEEYLKKSATQGPSDLQE